MIAATPHYLIDGLNAGYWLGNPPSLRPALALINALLARGHHAQAVFDASARYKLEAERETYLSLLKTHPQCLIEVPKGNDADRFILDSAKKHSAIVISNDQFRDHRRRYRSIVNHPERLAKGFIDTGKVMVPSLQIAAELPTSLETLAQEFRRIAPAG